jgi:hypothetical protein
MEVPRRRTCQRVSSIAIMLAGNPSIVSIDRSVLRWGPPDPDESYCNGISKNSSSFPVAATVNPLK